MYPKHHLMEILFDQPYLSELYFNGRCKDKRHRFQPEIIKRYIRVIDILNGASGIEELYPLHGLNYKKLTGDKEGIESVRVNNQYRVEFKTSLSGVEQTITICNILELSNHYSE